MFYDGQGVLLSTLLMKVLLIHGLARSPFSLLSLEQNLQQFGYATEHFGYVAFTESFDQIVERLRDRLQQSAAQGAYSIVAHSLGGLLTRSALGQSKLSQPHHIVMLGTPNQPPQLARQAWKFPPFRWFTGQCGFNLTCSRFYAALPTLQTPYTIVAGTGGLRGFWSPFGQEINDGVVTLRETHLSCSDCPVQLPVEHTFMMYDPAVQKAVVQALAVS